MMSTTFKKMILPAMLCLSLSAFADDEPGGNDDPGTTFEDHAGRTSSSVESQTPAGSTLLSLVAVAGIVAFVALRKPSGEQS